MTPRLQDPCWRELLRFCASRGAYKGAGSYAITQLVRSEGMSSVDYPGLTEALRHTQPGRLDDLCNRLELLKQSKPWIR